MAQTLIYLWYMYFQNSNGLQTMKQLCLDLLETFVCVYVHVWVRVSVCVPVSLFACVCLCIIAPSHSNYKMHLIHFPI